MGTKISTRFFTKRIDEFFDEADEALTTYAAKQYQEAADETAEWWSNRIRASGRGGRHNSDMANIEAAVTQPKKGGFFVRVGWLNGAPPAEDGRTTWYVYQDTGYDPFGMIRKGYNAQRVPGLFIQQDARDRLKANMQQANTRILHKIRVAAQKQRRGR